MKHNSPKWTNVQKNSLYLDSGWPFRPCLGLNSWPAEPKSPPCLPWYEGNIWKTNCRRGNFYSETWRDHKTRGAWTHFRLRNESSTNLFFQCDITIQIQWNNYFYQFCAIYLIHCDIDIVVSYMVRALSNSTSAVCMIRAISLCVSSCRYAIHIPDFFLIVRFGSLYTGYSGCHSVKPSHFVKDLSNYHWTVFRWPRFTEADKKHSLKLRPVSMAPSIVLGAETAWLCFGLRCQNKTTFYQEFIPTGGKRGGRPISPSSQKTAHVENGQLHFTSDRCNCDHIGYMNRRMCSVFVCAQTV
jgi:hypothetical protein